MTTKLGPPRETGQDPSPPTRRVVAVVELLAQASTRPLTLAEICRELRISRSTGYAILSTLCSTDWAVRDPLSGRYTLGPGLPSPDPVTTPLSRVLREPLRQLCSVLGMAACVSEVQGGIIAVVESAAPNFGRAQVQAGQRLPFVAPFGREFVAWAPAATRREWLDAAGPVNDAYRTRMPSVLEEIQRRGYGIERLSGSLVKVYTALLAMEYGDQPDPVAARLAGAVADLTVVDVLPDEMTQIEQHVLATISAPIFDGRGNVIMSVSAQPYRQLSQQQVSGIGDQIVEFAGRVKSLLTQHHLTDDAPVSR